jgi:hypothetical protein
MVRTNSTSLRAFVNPLIPWEVPLSGASAQAAAACDPSTAAATDDGRQDDPPACSRHRVGNAAISDRLQGLAGVAAGDDARHHRRGRHLRMPRPGTSSALGPASKIETVGVISPVVRPRLALRRPLLFAS